jgi:post-segregation antitoxin (ccd killing protein)
MSKKQKYKRLNLITDEESYDDAKWLKEHCHINISSLCREAISKKFKEMKEYEDSKVKQV